MARETSAFAVNNTETDVYYDQSGHVIVEDDTVIGQSTAALTADRENVWGYDGNLLFVEDQNTAHPQRGAVREYAQQDGQGNTTSVLMPTLGSDFLPTVIDALFDGESVHLTGSATDGYIGTLADGSVISATPDASDPTMQSFKQTLEGAISDLGTWQWSDGKWIATGNNDPGLTGLKTPFEVKERYVYDPHGLPTVLKSDWSGYDMSGGVPYGNNPKNSFNKSEITFRYLFGQQRWQGQTRLYETMGGGSYDPVLGASQQPRSAETNRPGEFTYTRAGHVLE